MRETERLSKAQLVVAMPPTPPTHTYMYVLAGANQCLLLNSPFRKQKTQSLHACSPVRASSSSANTLLPPAPPAREKTKPPMKKYIQLHCAAAGGSERVVRALLQAGSVPDVNQPILTENRESPLHIAAKHGHSGASAALISAGANVDCRDRNGWTPLHLASRFGRIQVATGSTNQAVVCQLFLRG